MAQSTRFQPFANRVQAHRNALGLSRKELAAKFFSPMTEHTIADWENGNYKPVGEMRAQLVEALEIPRWWELFIPEEEAAELTSAQARLLLTARHVQSDTYFLYVRSTTSKERKLATTLSNHYLVQAAGPDKHHKGTYLWQVTSWGEEIHDVLKDGRR